MPTETEMREAVVLQRKILGLILFTFDEGTIEDLWEIIDLEMDKRLIQAAVDALQERGTIQRTAKGWEVRQDVLAILQWGPKAIEILGKLGRLDNPATSDGDWTALNDIQEAAGPVATSAKDEGEREALRLQTAMEIIAEVKDEREAKPKTDATETPTDPEMDAVADIMLPSPQRDRVIIALSALGGWASRAEIEDEAREIFGESIRKDTVANVLHNGIRYTPMERRAFHSDGNIPATYSLTPLGISMVKKAKKGHRQ